MPALPVIAAVGAVVSAGATVASAVNANKARKQAKKQYGFERQLANNQAAKQRRDAIREARITRGALRQTMANSGAGGESSVALGALGSIQSQLNSSLSFLDTNQKLANHAGLAASRVNSLSSKAQLWGSVASAGMQVFSSAGGFDSVSQVFGGDRED